MGITWIGVDNGWEEVPTYSVAGNEFEDKIN